LPQVLHACALDVDLGALPGGMHARVGDRVSRPLIRPLPHAPCTPCTRATSSTCAHTHQPL
jgi:hypothetical protein